MTIFLDSGQTGFVGCTPEGEVKVSADCIYRRR